MRVSGQYVLFMMLGFGRLKKPPSVPSVQALLS